MRFGSMSVEASESYSPSLFGVAAGPTNQLSKIDDLVMYVDKSAAAEGGVVEATFKIVGAVKSSENVATFYTPNGFAITLDADAQSGSIAMDGATPIGAAAAATAAIPAAAAVPAADGRRRGDRLHSSDERGGDDGGGGGQPCTSCTPLRHCRGD